jgi:hypothetical protein
LAAQGKKVIDAGGQVLEILSQGNTRAAATEADLTAWIDAYDLNVSAMIDAASDPLGALNAAGIRETVFIVEMPSMKIAYVDHGDTTGRAASSIGVAVTKVVALLGK